MITELGKLLNDVTLKTVTTDNGDKSVVNNRIAIYQGKNRTTFIDITAWGGTAEFIARHFSKGDEIYVEGQIKNKIVAIEDKKIQTCFISVESVRNVYGKNAEITEREE